jgi:cytoskeletal protein RodZ
VRDFSRARTALHEAADVVRGAAPERPEPVAARSVRVVSADVPATERRSRSDIPRKWRTEAPPVMPDVSLPSRRPTRISTARRDPSWVGDLAAIGAGLAAARAERGESLDDIHEATLVPLVHLRAIEEGDREELPASIYVESFLRRYADHLGRPDLLPEEARQDRPVTLGLPGRAPRSRRARRRRAATVVVLVAGALAAAALVGGGNGQETATTTTSTTVTTVTTTAPPTTAAPAAPAAPAPVLVDQSPAGSRWAVGPSPAAVQVVAMTQTWARVVIDGATVFEGLMAPGQSGTWTAATDVTIRIGNPAGTQLSVAGHPLPLPQQAAPYDVAVAVQP